MSPEQVTLLAAVIVALPPTVFGLLSFRQTLKNQVAIQEVHVAVNDRLTQLLAITDVAGHARGVREGEASRIGPPPSP